MTFVVLALSFILTDLFETDYFNANIMLTFESQTHFKLMLTHQAMRRYCNDWSHPKTKLVTMTVSVVVILKLKLEVYTTDTKYCNK